MRIALVCIDSVAAASSIKRFGTAGEKSGIAGRSGQPRI
jgi:hypothetical protein